MTSGKVLPKLYFAMKCIVCGKEAPADKNFYKCECGNLLMPERDEEYIASQLGGGVTKRIYFDSIRYSRRARDYPYGSGVWMWLDYLLPGFPPELAVSLREGLTDLYEPPDWLKRKIGLNNFFIKMEGQNPSESFKDRGMPVAVSWARFQQEYFPEIGIVGVACASTGDTSASAAQYAAYCRDRLKCVIFLPYEKISRGQLAQAMMYGAKVVAVKHRDGFDGCMALIKEFCDKYPFFSLVNSANAFRLVGQESIALEISQDFGWRGPDFISIPVGNGGNLTALMMSLLRQKKHGLISKLPAIIVAQTKASNTLVRWARSGFQEYAPGKFADTVASAMNIQNPVSYPRIRKMMEKFEILFYDVSDEEIHRTRAMFNRAGGDICPQGAVAVNAVLQAQGQNRVKENDVVVAISTASGMKFAESAVEFHLNSRDSFANPYRVCEGNSVDDIAALLPDVS